MHEANLVEKFHDGVRYYDVGAGVYLEWRDKDPYMVRVISQDGKRTLGRFAALGSNDATLENANRVIRRHINTPGKPYGEWAGLWQAG